MEEKREKNPHKKPQMNNNEGNKERRNDNHGGNQGHENNSEHSKDSNRNGYNNYNKKKRYHKHKRRPPQEKEVNETAEAATLENAETIEQDSPHEEETVKKNIIDNSSADAEVSDTTTNEEEPKSEKSSIMVSVVGIRFKASGKTYYFEPAGITVRKGEYAIVETARGLEYGEVALANTEVSESDIVPPLRPLIRIATEADKAHHLENKKKEDEAFVLCNERILAHKLDMKLIDAQYTFDNTKLLFYFTSAGRVDFRELVKDLASVFRTRIELRQIGIRDEAKLIGGLGMCGRPLCCSVFLTDFGQVSIKMAKEQNLSLNSAKISGICGRLMCCLRYEHETYDYEIKRTPPVDSTVKTPDGIGTVTEINPLAGTVKVRLADKPDTPPKAYHRDNLTVISK